MSQKSILLTRHAKTEQPAPGQSDYSRALTKRGYADCEIIARELIQIDIVPDIIISSGAVRAVQTTKAFAQHFHDAGKSVELVQESELYLSAPETIFEVVKKYATSHHRLQIIAHNPGILEAAALLSTGGQSEAPTCATFHFDVPGEFNFNKKVSAKHVLFPRLFK